MATFNNNMTMDEIVDFSQLSTEELPTMEQFNRTVGAWKFRSQANRRYKLLTLCADTSASMNHRMDGRKTRLMVMNEQLLSLLRAPAIQAEADLTYVCIITFGGDTVQTVMEYTLLSEIDLDALAAKLPNVGKGMTPMGGAVLKAVDMGIAMRKTLRARSERSYANIAVLFTDGGANDTEDMKKAQDKVDFMLDSSAMQLLCFGISEEAKYDQLTKLLRNDRHGNGSGGKADIICNAEQASKAMVKVVLTTLAAAQNGNNLPLVSRNSTIGA